MDDFTIATSFQHGNPVGPARYCSRLCSLFGDHCAVAVRYWRDDSNAEARPRRPVAALPDFLWEHPRGYSDRKSVVMGQSGLLRVTRDGLRFIKKKYKQNT